MCLGRMRQAALTMTAMAAESGVPVLVAGSDATDEPLPFLAAGATAVLVGEGDHSLAEAVAALLGPQGDGLTGISGLVLPAPDGTARYTAARVPERQPDVFPLPARDLVDMEAYRALWHQEHGYFSTNMVSTRGCPFHCNWCAKPIWGQRYAMRSPWAVAEELATVKASVAPDHVWFADDIFGLRPEWTAEFGRAVETLNAQVPFQIQSRVDLINEAAAEGLARAGCVEVWLGVESGSQAVLDAMEKGIQVADVPGAVGRLRARGIRVGFFLQFGYPGETWSDILATVALVRDLLPDAIGISVSYPLPGTRFHDLVAAELGERRHWRDSQDLAMLFAGRYASDFYRALHQALHAELDARHAVAQAGDAASRASAEAELAGALGRWADLERHAPEHRTDAPTPLPAVTVARPAPDLTRLAN
jgi:anaerobic magnesium-protoporphyrin IX monomethyl ester cyclase